MMSLRRVGIRLQRQDWVQRLIGWLFVWYYRFVVLTSRKTFDPPEYATSIANQRPFVLAIWHGESLLVPFPMPVRWPMKAMTSRSRDGGIVATILEAVGIEPIRASGGRDARKISRRGGAIGLIQARDAIRRGAIVCMTADIPKGKAYEIGQGIVALARHGDCAVMPIAVVSSSHVRLKTWDRMVLALPFGRIHVMFGAPVRVIDGDEEGARLALQSEMERIHAEAYARVGRPGAHVGPTGDPTTAPMTDDPLDDTASDAGTAETRP